MVRDKEKKIEEFEKFVTFLDDRSIEGKELWRKSFKDIALPPIQEPSIEELFCWMIDRIKWLEKRIESRNVQEVVHRLGWWGGRRYD